MSDEWNAKLTRLQYEIDELRDALIETAPDALQRVISDYHACQTSNDWAAWKDTVTEAVTEYARMEVINFAKTHDGVEEKSISWVRAFCPLCHKGTTADWGARRIGWKLPTGLATHLHGEGQSRQCDVMKAICDRSFAYLKPRMVQADALEKQEREARQPRLLLDPNREPDSLKVIYEPRTPEGWKFAEARLERLGFAKTLEQNVLCYQLRCGDHLILADPRFSVRINFRTFDAHGKMQGHFYLMDIWKTDLKGKFDTRLTASMRSKVPLRSRP